MCTGLITTTTLKQPFIWITFVTNISLHKDSTFHTIKPTSALMLKIIFFYTQFITILTCLNLLWSSSNFSMIFKRDKPPHDVIYSYFKLTHPVHFSTILANKTETCNSPDINHCKNLQTCNLCILWTSSALLQMKLIISTNILCTNFNVVNNPSMLLHRL